MKIEYRTGNLFEDSSVKNVAHCCNAQGRMGSGFAKELRARNPSVYEAYHNAFDAWGLILGSVIDAEGEDGRFYLNIIGQQNFGYDGRRYVSYDALANAFETISLRYEDKIDHLAMPLIGAGLAGGKWSVIASIIESHLTVQPIVYLLDGKIPE